MGLTRVTAERYALSTHPASFTHQTAHLKREISRQVVSVFAQDRVLFAVPDIGAALLLVLLETVSREPPVVTVLSFLKNGGTQFGVTFQNHRTTCGLLCHTLPNILDIWVFKTCTTSHVQEAH